jgi:hypothetical protein
MAVGFSIRRFIMCRAASPHFYKYWCVQSTSNQLQITDRSQDHVSNRMARVLQRSLRYAPLAFKQLRVKLVSSIQSRQLSEANLHHRARTG